MAVIRELVTKFKFAVEGGKLRMTNTRIGNAKKAAKAATREMRRFRRETSQAIGAAKGLGVALVGHRVVKTLTTDYANLADSLAKTSQQVGVSIEKLQGLFFAGQLSGATTKQVTNGLGQLAKRANDASNGLQTSVRSFKALGVQVKNADGSLRSTDALLLDVADKFKAMPNGTKKTALAMELFGRAGRDLIPLLNSGSEGIKKMGKEFSSLGATISSKSAKDAEKFNDTMLRAKVAMTGVRNQIAAAVLPALTEMAKRFVEWAKTGDNVKRALKAIAIGAKVAGIAIAAMVTNRVLGLLRQYVFGVAAGARGLLIMALNAVKTQGALKAVGIAGARAMLKLGAIGLIGAALFDIVQWARGQPSVLSNLFSEAGVGPEIAAAFGSVKKAALEAFAALKPAISELWKAIKPIVPFLLIMLVTAIKGIAFVLKWIIKILAFVIRAIIWLFRKMATVFDKIIEGMVWTLDKLKSAWEAVIRFAIWITRKLQSAWQAMVRVIRAAIEGLKSAWDEVKKAGKSVANAIGRAFEFSAEKAKAAWVGLLHIIESIQEAMSISGLKAQFKAALAPLGITKLTKSEEGALMQRMGFARMARGGLAAAVPRVSPAPAVTNNTTNNVTVSPRVRVRTNASGKQIADAIGNVVTESYKVYDGINKPRTAVTP
jgi:hypothetical protein